MLSYGSQTWYTPLSLFHVDEISNNRCSAALEWDLLHLSATRRHYPCSGARLGSRAPRASHFRVRLDHFLPDFPLACLPLVPLVAVSNAALSSSRASFRASACHVQSTTHRPLNAVGSFVGKGHNLEVYRGQDRQNLRLCGRGWTLSNVYRKRKCETKTRYV